MSMRSRNPFDPYQLAESGLYLRDNTIANASTTKHGLLPKLSGNSAEFLNGAGAFATPAGSSSALIAPAGPKTPIVGANWSTRNAGSSTYTTSGRDSSVNIRVPASGSNAFSGQDTAVPGTPYTAILAVASPMLALNNMGFGVYFYEVGATKAIGIQIVIVSGTLSIFIQLSDTSFGFTGTVYTSSSLAWVPNLFALRDDGTNKSYWLGTEEEHLIKVFEHGRTTGITQDRIGFFGNPRQTSYDQSVTCFSYRTQSGAPT